LAHTSSALDAAIVQDVDCTTEDRLFFQTEKAVIDNLLDVVESAARAVSLHELREQKKAQTRVEIGDVVLDRGVRRGKKRLTLETSLKVADHVFGEDISEIVDAERHVEPTLVLECIGRLVQAADFTGKSELVADLKGRAERQAQNFVDRAATSLAASGLETTLANAIEQGADALYKLEKRLLERFPREKVYVRAFFLDVGRKRTKPTGE
jgi:uncharacterized protein YfcZ (UPF0381/DUF406 family)